MRKDTIGVASLVVSTLALGGAVVGGFYDPRTASIATLWVIAAVSIIAWAVWITHAVLTSRQLLSGLLESTQPEPTSTVPNFAHEPRYHVYESAPVTVDKRDRKAKLSAGFLNLPKFTIVFWVDVTEAFYWSDNNRYLFAYTSDIHDPNQYPNAFFMGIAGDEQRWRFVIKGPDVKNATKIVFPHSTALVGQKLISIRWDRHTKIIELDIDAGEALSEKREIEPDFWPQTTLHDQMHIGGWFDTWDGGLSLLRFFDFRVYDVRFTNKELKYLYDNERPHVRSRFSKNTRPRTKKD